MPDVYLKIRNLRLFKDQISVDYIFVTIFALFQVCFLIQLYFIVVVNAKLRAYKANDYLVRNQYPISVIICARNENKNLAENLPAICEQNYPDFEVIVVNDCSVDDSELVLRDFSAKYKNLKVVTINEHERFKHGKKFAVTLGIKAAKNEHLLFTDADCKPASEFWIGLMERNFSGETEIVLGYSPYSKLPGFVNKIIRLETFNTALNYLSFALAGDPYMGVGRNMAYTKSLFFKGKGFASHMHIPSGDDDLFVNQNATSTNTVIEISPDAQIWTEPKTTLSSYFTQKLRHLGAGKAYKSTHKRKLTVQAGSAILFYFFLITLIFLNAQWWILLAAFLGRLAVQLLVLYPIFRKLSYKDLFWWLPVLDFIYYFYIVILSIVSLFKKKVQWK